MKRIKIAVFMMQVLLVFWIIYNTYYGWNLHSENETEKILDKIVNGGLTVAFAIFFLPLIDVYRDFIKKYEANKK